jgi:DNA-binding NtrC family response regulator
VRIIAATNVNLEDAVRKGKFREDLFYRLNTVPIRVPSLKDRPEDITLLFRRFAGDFAEKYRMQPVRLDERAELVLENYRWPGNIRELKNVAEQLSVLSEERAITAESLQRTMPQLFNRHLPVPSNPTGSFHKGSSDFQERELLYKVLFDMKNDLNELKSMFFKLVESNNLRMPESNNFRQIPSGFGNFSESHFEETPFLRESAPRFQNLENDRVRPIIIDPSNSAGNFDDSEEEDMPLTMDEIEKDAIKKTLAKYKGRRKEAADELRISERTLYRKIKQYDL